MKAEESILKLIDDDHHSRDYFVEFFNKISSCGEIRDILRRKVRQDYGWMENNDKSIGTLDDIEVQLFIVILETNNWRRYICEKMAKELIRRIKSRFKDLIPEFVKRNNLLERETVFGQGGYILIPGHGFDFKGDSILIVNQYNLGGD